MLIALAAGIGIALKPQFVILWAAREGIVYWRTRRITPEGLVIPVVGAIYLAAVVLFTPEYFEVVRELGPAYHRFIRNPILVTALLGDGAALALGALIVSLALRRWVAAPRLVLALAVAVLACYLAAVFQQKGWRYHFYPALALGWILLSVIAISLRRPLVRWTERLFAGIAGAAALTVALAAAAGALVQAADPLHPRYDADPSVGRLIPWLREHAAGEPVMVLSPNMASGFPLTTYAGTRWVQRYSNLWPAVAAYADAIERPEPLALRPAAEAGPLEVRLREAVTAELIAARPPYVLVLRTGPDEPKWGMRRLDLVEFLRVDPRFAAEFAAYDSAGAIGQYVVHRRADAPPLAPVPRDPPPESRHAAAPDEMRLDPGALPAAALFLALLGYLYRASRRGGMNLSISEPG